MQNSLTWNLLDVLRMFIFSFTDKSIKQLNKIDSSDIQIFHLSINKQLIAINKHNHKNIKIEININIKNIFNYLRIIQHKQIPP